ncbi:MAG: choice-of-anchor L domain-containing protein, partial [Myxococcales bacterium]|nr:choice-of-anchor L domain-containing protein [Myxococcales bacterium]
AGRGGARGGGAAGGPTACPPAPGGPGGNNPFGGGPFGGGGDPFGGGGDPFGGGGDPFGGGGSNASGSGGSGLPICPACDSNTTDCDGDGWMVKDGDCCDQPGPCGQTPELQNPGAVEYQGDGVDNDCDGFFDENEKACDANLGSSPNDAFEYLKALDLCQFTKENVPLAQRKWGVISAEFTTAGGEAFPNPKQRSIRPKFGDNIFPLRGDSLLVLSSGVAADIYATAKTPPAWELGTNFENVSHSLNTSSTFPQDWLQANNGKLPTGCTNDGFGNTSANDSVMLKVRIRVPTNAHSFSLQGLFMSAEFPEFICSTFNDLFLVLVKNEGNKQPLSPNPPDGNVAFLRTGSGTNIKKFPVGINLAGNATAQKLFAACDPQKIGCSTSPVKIECALGPETLAGTGYDKETFNGCTIGGATDWLTVAGNVVPGGIVELRLLIADVGDHAYDSTVLLDNFRWNATPGTPGGSE